jgi:hypothetical protein
MSRHQSNRTNPAWHDIHIIPSLTFPIFFIALVILLAVNVIREGRHLALAPSPPEQQRQYSLLLCYMVKYNSLSLLVHKKKAPSGGCSHHIHLRQDQNAVLKAGNMFAL